MPPGPKAPFCLFWASVYNFQGMDLQVWNFFKNTEPIPAGGFFFNFRGEG